MNIYTRVENQIPRAFLKSFGLQGRGLERPLDEPDQDWQDAAREREEQAASEADDEWREHFEEEYYRPYDKDIFAEHQAEIEMEGAP